MSAPLDYRTPDAEHPHPKRSIATWILLILIWIVGLLVWALYIVFAGFLIVRFF